MSSDIIRCKSSTRVFMITLLRPMRAVHREKMQRVRHPMLKCRNVSSSFFISKHLTDLPQSCPLNARKNPKTQYQSLMLRIPHENERERTPAQVRLPRPRSESIFRIANGGMTENTGLREGLIS